MKKSTSGLSDASTSEIENSALFQNSPNPFNETTTIGYNITEIQSSARINIYNLQGKEIKSIPVYIIGHNEVHIDGNALDPGIYIYILIVDDQVIDSKQMILTS